MRTVAGMSGMSTLRRRDRFKGSRGKLKTLEEAFTPLSMQQVFPECSSQIQFRPDTCPFRNPQNKS